MDLVTYVITKKGITDDGSQGCVANIPDYYDRYIVNLDSKYSKYSFRNGGLNGKVLCFMHSDHDPSLGLMKNKFLDGVLMYHCFGCGKVGNVVTLHMNKVKKFDGRNIDENEAAREVADLFDISLVDFASESEESLIERHMRNKRKVDKLASVYTRKDFANILKESRKQGVFTLDLLNREYVRLVATEKRLYEW